MSRFPSAPRDRQPSSQELVEKIARMDASVLIQGEPGTGKTQLAKVIVRHSARARQPLYVVECVGAAELETVFSAAMSKPGTLLLENVDALAPNLQGELLRYIHEGRSRGAHGSTKGGDLRLIATTRRSLRELVTAGQFREDLHYRLSILAPMFLGAASEVPVNYWHISPQEIVALRK